MSTDFVRPCELAQLLEVVDKGISKSGPVVDVELFDWPAVAGSLDFVRAGLVLVDKDWDALPSIKDDDIRFLMLHDGEQWVLRWGVTDVDVDPSRFMRGAGTHQAMLTLTEARSALSSGYAIRTGYIHEVTDKKLVIY